MDLTPNGNPVLDFDPRNLPQEHLAAIGLMSAAASVTDGTVQMAIAGMLGLDGEQGWAVTSHMPGPLRMSVLRSAAEIAIMNGKALDVLDEILDAIKKAVEDRNDMVHGQWATRPTDGKILLVQQQARTHVEARSRPVSVDEIKGKALALYEAGMSLLQFLIAFEKIPALPRERVRGINTPKARKARRKKNGE